MGHRGPDADFEVEFSMRHGGKFTAPLQNRKGRWYLDLRAYNVKSKMISLRTGNLTEAQALGRSKLEEIAVALAPTRTAASPGNNPAFSVLAERFATEVHGHQPYNAAARIKARLKELQRFLAARAEAEDRSLYVYSLSAVDCEAFRTWLAHEATSHETAKKRWQAACNFWLYLRRKGYTSPDARSPFEGFRQPPPPQRARAADRQGSDRARGALSLAECAAFEALCWSRVESENPEDRRRAQSGLLMLYTGARPVSMQLLRPNDLDTRGWQVALRSAKGAGPREAGVRREYERHWTPVPTKLRTMVKQLKAETKNQEFVWPNPRNPKEPRTTWWRSWRRWFDDAGLPEVDSQGNILTLYSLRNTFTAACHARVTFDASQQAFVRMAAEDIQALLGHSNYTTTQRYRAYWKDVGVFRGEIDFTAWHQEHLTRK